MKNIKITISIDDGDPSEHEFVKHSDKLGNYTFINMTMDAIKGEILKQGFGEKP